MPRTTPIPASLVNRIPCRVASDRTERDFVNTEVNTLSLSSPAICGSSPLADQSFERLARSKFQLWEDDAVFLIKDSVTPIVVFVEFKGSGNIDDPHSSRPIDRSQVEAFLFAQQPPARQERQYEWDEYDEPLWDPLRSEVQLLVTEYFEQADADTD